MARWTEADVPDQQGRVALITGANSGLGFENAWMLAQKGATVVMACRNPSKAEAARAAVVAKAPGATVELLALDLADLGSVRAAAARFRAKFSSLDLLVNNAGVMALPLTRTAQGFEMQIGTNHLGHFLLTALLDPLLAATPGARTVQVASMAHRMGKIRLDDLNWERKGAYSAWPAYGQTKLANLLFAYELDRRYRAAGRTTLSVAAHPGYSSTNLSLVGPQMAGSTLRAKASALSNAVVAQSAYQGALPQVYAAVMPDVAAGSYWGPDGWMELRGWPTQVDSNARSKDETVAAALWGLSEQLVGQTFVVA